MFNYVVIGMTGEGKSRYTKAMITQPRMINMPCYVFDVQNEYGEFYWGQDAEGRQVQFRGPNLVANRPELPRSRYAGKEMDMDVFLENCAMKENTNIIFEEATIFFEGRTDKRLRSLMVGKRHTRNNFVFVFHTLMAVPPRIMQMTDFLILHKTQDTYDDVRKRFNNPKLLEAYLRQSKKPRKSPPEQIRLS